MRRGSAQVTGLINVGSAPGIRCPASSPSRGKMPDPNTHTAAQAAAVAVLSCCTGCSNRSNFTSPVQVTVSGRPHESAGIQAGCCTFVLYRPGRRCGLQASAGLGQTARERHRAGQPWPSAAPRPHPAPRPTPAEKPRSVATSRTPRIRQTRPTSGAINAQRSAGSSRYGGMPRGSPSARRISDGRPRGLPGHLRFGCWHRPDAPGSCGTSAARAAAGI